MKTFNIAYHLKDKEYYMTFTCFSIMEAFDYFRILNDKEDITMIKITQSKVTLRKDVEVVNP